eukprot:692345-Rhodomonas_salina.1
MAELLLEDLSGHALRVVGQVVRGASLVPQYPHSVQKHRVAAYSHSVPRLTYCHTRTQYKASRSSIPTLGAKTRVLSYPHSRDTRTEYKDLRSAVPNLSTEHRVAPYTISVQNMAYRARSSIKVPVPALPFLPEALPPLLPGSSIRKLSTSTYYLQPVAVYASSVPARTTCTP